jgi:Ca-activated chloride channel family protein
MKFTRYSKWDDLDPDQIDLEGLLDRLADFLLGGWHYYSSESSLEELRRAIMRELVESDLAEESIDEGSKLARLIDRLIERLIEEGYISVGEQGRRAEALSPKFEITEKGLDLLGFKALKELLAAIGRSSFGRHDTDRLSTGIEAEFEPKPYEFGDAMNLDASATLLAALCREGPSVPINLEYSDLMVRQSHYQSSCATVLMLDCSHSMVLYGEDRFTPAKRVALALAHLVRTQYPGDALRVVLFHDSAEEIPLGRLGRARVGPYYTNTREGLRLARRILARERKDMQQIIMITDGKPSAITLEDGRIYKNPMGLDPYIIEETLKEVAACRRSRIMINTFMLADDYYLVDFVRRVTEMCRGRAYFTTTLTLGQYILMDYLRKRTRKIR